MDSQQKDILVRAFSSAGAPKPDVLKRARMMTVDGEPDSMSVEYKVRSITPAATWTLRNTLAVHQIAEEVGVRVRIAGLPENDDEPERVMVVWR